MTNNVRAVVVIIQRILRDRPHRSSFSVQASKKIRTQDVQVAKYMPKKSVSQKFPKSCAVVIGKGSRSTVLFDMTFEGLKRERGCLSVRKEYHKCTGKKLHATFIPCYFFFIKYHQFMRGHNLASPPSRRMEINNLDPVEGHLGPASVHSPFIEHFLVNPSEN